jgi:ABC-type multidrug transport system ATPase subunit
LPGGLYESIDVLLADKPTRGVDIGAKRAIYDVLQSVGRRGAGVLFISSEIEEIIRVARRVLVMRHGRVVSTVNGDDIKRGDDHAFGIRRSPQERSRGRTSLTLTRFARDLDLGRAAGAST